MKKELKKKAKIKLKNPKRLLLFLLIIIILFVVVFKNKSTIKIKENLSFVINNEDVINKLEHQPLVKENIVYLSFNDVKNCLDANIYKEDEKILTGNSRKIAVLKLNNRNIEINGSNIQLKGMAFKDDNNIIYLPISEMQNVYDMEFSYIPEYKNMILDSFSQKQEKAITSKSVLLKSEMNNSSSNIEKIEKENWGIYISEQNGWAKIRTQNGNIGYIKNKNLIDHTVEREQMQEVNKEVNDVTLEKDITKENIKKYEDRKNVIDQILIQTVAKKQEAIRVIYKKDKEKNKYKRFKLEATAILKECGITVIFE